MNQQIYDLVGQAKFMAEEELNRKISYNAELKAFAEKFAELIVQECADVANQHMEHNEGTDYNVGGKIKQHFGVEDPPVDNVDRILRTVRKRSK